MRRGKTRKRGLISDSEIKKIYIQQNLTMKDLSLMSGLSLARIEKILKGIRGSGNKHELKTGGNEE